MYSVSDETRKPIFEGVQGENEAREIQFDVTAWVEELGEGVCTATAKRPTDTTPYPVTVTRSGNVVTWKPNSTDTSIEGIGAFQLAFSINDVVAKTRIWNTKIAPSLVGAGDPPDPYDDWIEDLRDIAAETLTYSQNAENSADDAETEKLEAEAWAKGTKNGTPVPSTADQYQNNAKYWAEQSLANQYSAFIVKSASGEIASFSDGADDVPMKSVKVAIVPKQSGSGDPSPDNVRPITGTSTADVHVTGINAWDEVWENGVFNTTTGTNQNNANQIRSKNRFPIAPNTEYYVSAPKNMWVIFFDADGNVVPNGQPSQYVKDGNSFACGGYTGSSSFLNKFTTPSNAYYMRFYCVGGYGATYNNDISINYPSTDTEYHPYTGHTTPVPFGQTVYGGTVNPISGELVIDRSIVIYDGSNDENWRSETGSQYTGVNFYVSKPSGTKYGNDESVTSLMASNIVSYIGDLPRQDGCLVSGSYFNFIIGNAIGISDVASFRTWLSTHNIQMVYPLANPTTVQLTQTQVATLLGTNNVWADCGSVAVEYRADPTLAYNELANVIVSLGGNI